jgi:DNA ligase-associated metallophosphoesterase
MRAILGGDVQSWPMTAIATNGIAPTPTAAGADIVVADMPFTALASGALWCDEERTLIVADLHFEKGSAFARRGQMLPPYDTAVTLAALSALVFRLDPARVVALGDSFHDNDGALRLQAYDRAALASLQRGREWIWIAGNHDDDLPDMLDGDRADEVSLGAVILRHEPSERDGFGEIAGHLHPAARVAGRASAVSVVGSSVAPGAKPLRAIT